jgi:hypothetical protein
VNGKPVITPEGAIKPKVLLIVLLSLVALFIFSTALSVGGKGMFTPNSPPLLTRLSASLAQPVQGDEIRLAGGQQGARCAWDGERMRIPTGAVCHFEIRPGQSSRWQINRTWQLQLRLSSQDSSVSAILEMENADERPQEEELKGPVSPGRGAVTAPGQGGLPTATPQPAPTPVQFTVYALENQVPVWRLTLYNCSAEEAETCQVELVK